MPCYGVTPSALVVTHHARWLYEWMWQPVTKLSPCGAEYLNRETMTKRQVSLTLLLLVSSSLGLRGASDRVNVLVWRKLFQNWGVQRNCLVVSNTAWPTRSVTWFCCMFCWKFRWLLDCYHSRPATKLFATGILMKICQKTSQLRWWVALSALWFS